MLSPSAPPPQPRGLLCHDPSCAIPRYEYTNHGRISRQQAEQLLLNSDGCNFLVRESERAPGEFSLAMRIDSQFKHYRIHFEDGKHFVDKSQRRFESIYELVLDGLMSMQIANAAGGETSPAPQRRSNPSLTLPSGAAPHGAGAAGPPPISPSYHQSSPGPIPNVASGFGSVRFKPPPPLPPIISDRQKSPPPGDTLSPTALSPQPITPPAYVKDHKLETVTFTHPTWCLHCKGLLWGIKSQGLKCKDCGYTCHRLCKDLAGACVPLKKHLKKVFGTDLTFFVVASESRYPIVVEKCINEVTARGMREEGIYRLSGASSETLAFKEAFDKDPNGVDLSTAKDINSVAGLLKTYFRELPVPLIPFDFYDRFIETSKVAGEVDQVALLKALVNDLPAPHFETLKYLIHHLEHVTTFSAFNKMTAVNLGVIFGPTLLRCKSDSDASSVMDAKFQGVAITLLISHASKIFV